MISIIPKPTDTPTDNSTGMVIDELRRAHAGFEIIDLDSVDPFNSSLDDSVIWVCGLRQEEHQFETLQALSITNRVINSPSAIATCASKVHTSALLLRQGIQTPETCFTSSRKTAESLSQNEEKAVYKPVYGFDGNESFSSHHRMNSDLLHTISRNTWPMIGISVYSSLMALLSEQSSGSPKVLPIISIRGDVGERAK